MKRAWLYLLISTLTAPAYSEQPNTSEIDCAKYGAMTQYIPECGGTRPKSNWPTQEDYQIKQDAATAWAKAYLACTYVNVAALDDGVSDASTITIGMHSRCKSILPDQRKLLSEDQIDDMCARLRPSLVELVLARRATPHPSKQKPSTIKPKT